MENTSKKGFYLIQEEDKYSIIRADVPLSAGTKALAYCTETKDISYTMLRHSCKKIREYGYLVEAVKHEIALSRDFPVVSDTLGLILASSMGKEITRAIAEGPL